jgi:hypothetical protein
MTKYLLLYHAPVSATEQMAAGSPEQAEAGMQEWMNWAGKAGDAIVDLGSPLSTVGGVPKPPVADGDFIGGFSIMEADSINALEKLLDGHPHLMADSGSIEILEYLPIPGG